MTRYFALFAVLGVVACDGGDPDDSTETFTSIEDCVDSGKTEEECEDLVVDDGDTCDNAIIFPTHPEENATDAYYRTTVEITFKAADTDATLGLTNAGADVAGTTAWSGDTLIFTPAAALDPATKYTANVSYECADDVEISFTTSEVGGEAACAADQTFMLDIASGRFVEPAGVGPLLQQQLTVDILIGITDIDETAGTIEMMGAISEDGVSTVQQDPCTETIEFPTAADFSNNPFFSVGPDTTDLSVAGYDITVQDLQITGAFSPDCSYISGATLAGSVDTRPLVPLLDEEGDDDTICLLVETFGVTCVECAAPADAGPYCLSLVVDSITAIEEDGLVLYSNTSDMIAADPACAP
jgi:hypothetical protein